MRQTAMLTQMGHVSVFVAMSAAALCYHHVLGLRALRLPSFGRKTLEDKRKRLVVISGCDTGFGKQLVEDLVASTHQDIVVLALTLTAEASTAFLAIGSKRLFAFTCDVTNDADVAAMKAYAEDIMNKEQAVLHTIVNNAGVVSPGDFLWFADISSHQRVMDVNFFGQLRVTKALLPLMLRTSKTLVEGARILNLSSVCGTSATPANSSYAASKFAVEAWSDSLRLELEPFNISVVKFRPGQIDTGIQRDYGLNAMRNFEKAPAGIRHLYGGDQYGDKLVASFQSMADGTSMNGSPKASLVSGYLMDKITCQKTDLKPSYFIGADANTLFRALTTLPTTVCDTVKRLIRISPVDKAMPRTGTIAHFSIRVRNIEKSLPFYTAFGLEPVGGVVNGQQFLRQGKSSLSETPMMLLLVEDASMAARGRCLDAGMSRLCLYSMDIEAEVKHLEKMGMKTLAPLATAKDGNKIAAYHDPDNFVVYLIEFTGLIGRYIRYSLGLGKRMAPYLFHITVNVTDVKKALPVFEGLGFKSISDQTRKQVIYDLLPAFNIVEEGSVIEHIRLCQQPGDVMVATIMEWVTPRTTKTGTELLNSLTLSVPDVHAALEKAEKCGMTITQHPEYRRVPVWGDVLVGVAVVDGNAAIEFCCFLNQKV